jgi:hypothetical protein
MIVLTKLNTIDAFNLIGINKRVDNILYDRVIRNHPNLWVKKVSSKFRAHFF